MDNNRLLLFLVFLPLVSLAQGPEPTTSDAGDPLCANTVASRGENSHLERLAQLGEIAGGAVHDINSLVTGILFQLEGALAQPEGDHVANMQRAVEQARRIARMARAITDFTRTETGAPVRLRLEEQVRRMIEVCNYFLQTHEVTFTPEEDLFDVILTSVQLDQVLLNLLVNADKAMANSGAIRIHASNVVLTEPILYDRGVIAPDLYVRLDVTDTGVGIPEHLLGKIFDRHFTTRGQNGTGLGLSTTSDIMHAHGGHILVSSEVGKGTTFSLYFPAAAGEATADNSDVPLKSETIRVLLVDDDEDLLEAERAALSCIAGKYDILTASTVEQARQLFEANRENLDVAVIDYGLRGLRGTELADEFRAKVPALLVLVTSGTHRSNSTYPIFIKDPANNLDVEIQRLIKEADED